MSNNECYGETALSTSVKNLLCVYGKGIWTVEGSNDGNDIHYQNVQAPPNSNSNVDDIFLDASGLLNIELCSCFVKSDEREALQKDSSYYSRAAYKLAPTFKECEKFWSEKNLGEFSQQCGQYLRWTGKEQLFLDCFELLAQKSESRDVLVLLLLCTGIEQTLRNVFVVENEEQCPMLLKDILASREIEHYIGKAAAQLLQILLGPPISMNLRNVVWHGFLSEGEISPRYAYFLLIFVASLSTQVSSKGLNEHSLPPRKFFPLSKVDCIRNSLQVDLPDSLLGSIRESVESSWVAGARNKKLIQDVFDLHADKKYGFSCVQGFPILEHALRRRFVKVNNCPNRLLTAEATTLYTTYEEILDSLLPDGQKNQLVCDLGEPFMDLLHDLLIYPNGPRARDRLGHGEADVYDTPPSLSLSIIICLFYLSTKGWDENHTSTSDPPIRDLIASVDNYESQFHPVSELKRQILALSLKSSQIHRCIRTDPDLQPWNLDSPPDIFIKDNCTFHCIVPAVVELLHHLDKHKLWDSSTMKSRLETPFENVHDAVSIALRPRVLTLHRWQNKAKTQESNVSESEIISLMDRVISEMDTVLDQMHHALEQRQEALENRLLRSRQRDNTKRLVNLFPNIILAVNFQSFVWTWLFRLLNQTDRDLSPVFKRIQKFLKCTLQLAENLRTCTGKENNKWSKAEEILVTCVKNGVEFACGLPV